MFDAYQILTREEVAECVGVAQNTISVQVDRGWSGTIGSIDGARRAYSLQNLFSLIITNKVKEYVQPRDVPAIGEYVRARWDSYNNRGAGLEALGQKLLVITVRYVDLYRQIDFKLAGLNGQPDSIDEEPTQEYEMQIRIRLDEVWDRIENACENASVKEFIEA